MSSHTTVAFLEYAFVFLFTTESVLFAGTKSFALLASPRAFLLTTAHSSLGGVESVSMSSRQTDTTSQPSKVELVVTVRFGHKLLSHIYAS